MSLPTPTWITTEEYTIADRGTEKVLPSGSFVRPIALYYVPKHRIEENSKLNPEKEVFCYTHYGIIVLPLNILRKV